MGNTIQKSDSAFLSFLDNLHKAGVKDGQIDGNVADDAVGGPGIGQCKTGGPRDGKIDRVEVFALALNNLTSHGDSVRRFFQQIGFTEIDQLQNNGQFGVPYRQKVQSELLGSEPRRSLKAWPNPDKLKPEDPNYAKELVAWSLKNTRVGLLPHSEQIEVFKKFGLPEAAVKGPLARHWQDLTLPKILAQASVLKGEDLLQEAKDRRRVGGAREAQDLEGSAHRLFRTAVELDGKNPQARLRLAESFERKERFADAGLHYAQAIVDGAAPAEVEKILERLSFESGREMLGKHRDAFSFVGAHLMEAGRFVEAAALYHRAAESASTAGQHHKSLRFTELEMTAQEKVAPFAQDFSADSNPVANALYKTLRDAGIPSALLDGASGKEGDVPDRKISAAEVFGYLDSNWGDKRVKGAMAKLGFELPWLNSKGRVKKEFNTPEFSKLNLAQRFGVWHEAQAKKLQADGVAGDAGLIEKHLKFATYYDGANPGRHKALGDFYLGQKNGGQAKAAYATALALEPGFRELALPMARAQALSGDRREALKSYQSYLTANPSDVEAKKEFESVSSEFLSERTKAFDGQLSAFKLLSASHPDKAEQALKDLEATLGELQSLRSGGPEQSYERLLRTQAYYKAAIDFQNSHVPTLSVWDSTKYDAHQAKTKGLEANLQRAQGEVHALLEGEIRPAMLASGSAAGDEIALAKLALRIDRESGDAVALVSDMKTAVALVQALPPSTAPSEKAEHFAALLREWTSPSNAARKNIFTQGLSGLTPAAAKGLEDDIKAGILDNSPADQRGALSVLIDKSLEGKAKVAEFLAPGGPAKYVEASQAADAAFAEAKGLEDPKAQRGAMLGVLSNYVKLGRSADVDTVIKAIDATFTDKAKQEDKLYMTTAMLMALKGSGLPAEKALRDQGDILARQMAVCGSDPRTNVKRRMAELNYYSSVGNTQGQEEAQRGLSRATDDILNYLFSGNPQAGIPKPTDAKTRIELASLAVELDLMLVGVDAGQAGDPKSHGAIALTTRVPRLEVLSRELAKAKDLPPEDKVVALGLLSRASATYEPLAKAFPQLVSAEALKKVNDGVDGAMAQSFDELLKQPEGASTDQSKLAGKIAEDFKSRYRAAVKSGDQAWLSNLTPTSIKEFAEYSQNAQVLLWDAAQLKGPRGFERRLQAAKIFGELGLSDRVKESLEPVKLYAESIKDPKMKAGFLFTLAQLYQGGGQKTEADSVFRSIEALGGPGAAPQLKELATLASGLRELNAGDTAAAQATLASIPENPTAQVLLGALRKNVEARRLGTSVAVLRSISLNFLERGRDATFGGFSKDEYESMKRDTLAGYEEVQRLVASGDSPNLSMAIAQVAGDSRFPGFRTGFRGGGIDTDPHTSDSSEFHIGSNVGYFLMGSENPAYSDKDFAKAAYDLGQMVSADGYYSAKAGIMDALKDDPYMGKEAREALEGLPTEIKVRGGINLAWNIVSFAAGPAGVIGANSTSGAGGGDYVENVAMGLVPFGIARGFAVGAEAVYLARTASLVRNASPMVNTLHKFGGFMVGKSAEAAGFTLGNMAMITVLKGKTDQWTMGHFGQEFGTMLVTFVLLHGAGMALKGAGSWSGRAAGRAEADMARAIESGQGLQAAAFRMRLTSGMESVAKSGITGWGTRVMAFTGAEYFTEAVGLKPAEPGIPFWARLLSSAVMDAQMIVAGKKIDALSGGRLGKIEKANQQKYAEADLGVETRRLMPVLEKMGLDPASPAGRQTLQTLLASRYGGESFASISKRVEAEQGTYEKVVKEQLGIDPKSAEGRQALALLMGYAQNHAFAGPGRPLSAAEVAKNSAEFYDAATKLLQGAGLEAHGPQLQSMRQSLVAFALRTGMDPALLADYAKHAPALRPTLKNAAEAILGAEGARTPEGQALIGELLVFSMFRASSPDKMAISLEPLLHPKVGAELRKDLNAQAELVFGKGGAETPAGRQLMSFLVLRAAHGADSLAELPLRIGEGKEALAKLPILATVSGLNKPAQRLALARWALEKGMSAENLQGLSRLVLQGHLEIKLQPNGLHVYQVPEGQRSAKAKEVLDRLPELPPELLKPDRAGDAKAEQEIFPVTDDMILPLDQPPPLPEKALPEVTDDMIVDVKPLPKKGGGDEAIPVTDDMILPDGDATKVVSNDAPTRVAKVEGDSTVVVDFEAKTKVVKSGDGEGTKVDIKKPAAKSELDSESTKADIVKPAPALAKEGSDSGVTKVLSKKKAPAPGADSGDFTKVDRLAARKGGTPQPQPLANEGGDALGDSRTGGQAFGAKLASTDGKIDLNLDFRQGNVLYVGGRAGLRETSISLETLDSPQAEIALVKSEGKVAYRIQPLAKGKVEYFDAAKNAWAEVGPEGFNLKSGQRLRIGGEEVHWEPPVAQLKSVGSSKGPAFTEATFDAMFATRSKESTELVGLVETLNTGTDPHPEIWISSTANAETPNGAHSPVYTFWKHFTQAETRADYEVHGEVQAAIAEYRVDIRGQQRMSDTIARLKANYGDRLVTVDSSSELGSTFVLQGQDGKGVIRIVIQDKGLKIPSSAEARTVLADFAKNDLADLQSVANGTDLRANYAQTVLDMLGTSKTSDGKEAYGKNLEAAIERSEKAATPEERARAGEEVARLVAYLRDVPTLKVEENLIHRSDEVRSGDLGWAVKWVERNNAEAGKGLAEDYINLGSYQAEVRRLGQELINLVPQEQQKPGNVVYDEYVAARDRLESATGRLEKSLKDYQRSEAYLQDQATKAKAFQPTPKEDPVFEVTDDMLLPIEDSTKVGKTPQKAKVMGASDQEGGDLRLFRQDEIAWLGAFGVPASEKLANPQSAEYAQTLFDGLNLLLKEPRGDASSMEWAVVRIVGALRQTARAEGGTWESWLKDTLNPTLDAYGRGVGGGSKPGIALSVQQQSLLGGGIKEVRADNVMEVISRVKTHSTLLGTKKYPQGFLPNNEGAAILKLAVDRFGGVIKAKDPQLHEFLEGLYPKAKAQSFPVADSSLSNPEAARAGRVAAVASAGPAVQGKVSLDATQGVGADLATFLNDRVHLADQVQLPGVKMTPELRAELRKAEQEFEQGGMVFEFAPGKPMFMQRLSGAETMMTAPASAELAQFYGIWKSGRSFETVDAATAQKTYAELKARTDSLGIKLFIGEEGIRKAGTDFEGDLKSLGGALTYLNQLMKLLPDSMLGNMHLKELHLSVPRQGAGMLSSYDPDTGAVFLYSGSFTGARRYMAALLFHELGHSTAERYDSGKTGDPTIPLAVRKTMESAHKTLLDSRAMLGLDWASGAEHRAAYQDSMTEFLAELNLMYVTAGPKLRQHIQKFPEGSRERMAWDFVYSEMRDRVFQGVEYDYRGIKPTAAAKADPAAEPLKFNEPNRDFILTKGLADQSSIEMVLSANLDAPYSSKDPYLMIPADPDMATPQLFGVLTQRGADLWFSPQQKKIRVTDATGKLKGLRGSQTPVKLEPGDTIEVAFYKFKYDGEKLSPDGTITMKRFDPKPVLAPTTAESVLQDNVPGQGRVGSLSRDATSEYGSVSVHTDEGVGYKAHLNEDGFVQGSNWAIVLDGMGGMGSGDKASAVAGREFQRLLEDPGFNGDMVQAMVLAGRKVNAEVNGGEAKTGQSGTAAVAHRILKQPDGTYQLQLAVSGDAGAILFRADGHGGYESYFRTKEQSMVGAFREMGQIKNTLVARRDPNANIVTDGLGLNKDAKPLPETQTINPGDRLLMFSDGIGDSFSKEELGFLLRGAKTPEDAQTRIVDAAHLKMERLQKGKAAFRDPQQIQELPDGQNGMIGAVAVEGLPGFYMGKDGTIYGRVVEFRDGSGARKYGVEVPWSKGSYYTENARGEGQVVAGTFSSDRGYYGAVDKYKSDNLTVHVYFHDVAGAKSASGKAKPQAPAPDPDQTQVFVKPALAQQGSDGSWSFKLEGKQVLAVGRNVVKGQIVIPDTTVSREHAEIFVNQGEYWIRDKGSLGGTSVNGRQVPRGDAIAIDPGNKVRIGNVVFTFQVLANGSVQLTPSN